jgi:hypothetical protein
MRLELELVLQKILSGGNNWGAFPHLIGHLPFVNFMRIHSPPNHVGHEAGSQW